MIYEEFKTDNEALNAYIEDLESKVSSFGASNSKRLIREIDLMAGEISDQLEAKRKENPEEKKVEVSGKLIDSYIKLCEKADKIQKFIDISEEIFGGKKLQEKETEQVAEESSNEKQVDTPTVPITNFFEETLRKVKTK